MADNIPVKNIIPIDPDGRYILIIENIHPEEAEYMVRRLQDWWASNEPVGILLTWGDRTVKLVKADEVKEIQVNGET